MRCVTTVAPLAAATGIPIKRDEGISQDAWESGNDEVRRVVGKRVRAGKPAVICSHGPVLPEMVREIALATATPLGSYVTDAAGLEPGAFSVVHLSATNSGLGHRRDRDARAPRLTRAASGATSTARTPSLRHPCDRARSPPVHRRGGSS